MLFKQPLLPTAWLMAIGLLLVVLPFLVKRFLQLPDAVSGFSVGLGIGMALIGLGKLLKKRTKASA